MKRTSISKSTRRQLFDIQKGKCKLCGEPFEEIYLTAIDHIVPFGLGGIDRYDNFQLLCLSCHSEKTRQDMINICNNKRLHREKYIKTQQDEGEKK